MRTFQTPGVYFEEVAVQPTVELRTGVPAFLGFVRPGLDASELNLPRTLSTWGELAQRFGPPLADGFLAPAVRGFFENGGRQCTVVALDPGADPPAALVAGLARLEPLDSLDLVCAPDIMRPREGQPLLKADVQVMQAAVLEHCDARANRLAILDAWPLDTGAVLDQRNGLSGTNGALYFPWVRVPGGPTATDGLVPPCGHLAGVYAACDERVGVHKSPANERLAGVVDLAVNTTAAQQADLNPAGVNCLRAFPGRGIRVWGARTLSLDPDWTYISVRRLFLTVGRWIERSLLAAVFEPDDAALWARIRRDVTLYCERLHREGALQGRTSQEAFYVKCDAETNPSELRDTGTVVTEIGLAPALPGEFIVARVIQSPGGIAIAGRNGGR